MNVKGISRNRILNSLSRRLSEDLNFESGKIFGSMCTEPHNFARSVYSAYLEKNIGDPGLLRGTLDLERDCIRIIGTLLSHSKASGHIVSGGTEANVMALWSARNESRKEKPEVILSSLAHHSFKKAGDLLGLRLVVIPSDKHKFDTSKISDAITSHTILMIGTAGSTDLGLIDPIQEMSEISSRFQIPIHVDASFGGFVIPFLKARGSDLPDFDFRLKAVRSITIDPHKMGMAPIPSGALLFRNRRALDTISYDTDYLSGGLKPRGTILGTSPGASIVSVWSLLNLMGQEGYKKTARSCMRLTEYLYQRLAGIDGVVVISKPEMNVLGFRSSRIKISVLSRRLRNKGYAISTFPTHLRLVIMPHVTRSHVELFIETLVGVLANKGHSN
ncbi:MAG: tyrosine decarboxylase MfnA [Nitrososphaerales archaeon]